MIWFDFENAPHVLFWRPIISYCQKHDIEFLVTARDFSYTKKLLRKVEYEYFLCKEGGKKISTVAKYTSVLKRGLELTKYVKGRKIRLACSFGSRAQIIACTLSRIPVISSEDYEFANMAHAKFAKLTLIPKAIPKERIGVSESKVLHYDGFKEDMYMFDYEPQEIDISSDQSKVVVLFRPGDYYSHYQNAEYHNIEKGLLNLLVENKAKVFLLVFPRHQEQRAYLENFFLEKSIPFEFLKPGYFGPDVIWKSDLIIGGGGTMLREACVLNVPAYSFFSGTTGGVDEHYVKTGKMRLIKNASDLSKIDFVQCGKKFITRNKKVFEAFRDVIMKELGSEPRSR